MLPENLMAELLKFRTERDWEQFHTPRSLSVSVALEASELLQLFQWQERSPEELEKIMPRIREEAADVAIYLSYLCHDLKIDLDAAVRGKMQQNAQKYPVALAKGSARKYNER